MLRESSEKCILADAENYLQTQRSSVVGRRNGSTEQKRGSGKHIL